MEVQGELYVALDEEYILASEFKVVSEQARRIRHDGLPFVDSSTISRNLPAIRQAGIKCAKQLTLNLEL